MRRYCRDGPRIPRTDASALWNLFHAKDPKDHEWHYRGLAEALKELDGTYAYQEFVKLINQVFA